MPRSTVFVAVLLACGLAAVSFADDLYVAPNGNDRWSGRLAAPNPSKTDGPLATLAAAVEAARQLEAGAPRRILVRGGKYFVTAPVTLEARDSGLAIEAAPGEKPLLIGGRLIKGWKRDGGNLWSASLPEAASGQWDFRMLAVNGRFSRRARLPQKETFTHLSEFKVRWMGTNGGGWQRKPTEEELTTLKYKPGDLGPWLDIKNAELTVYHMWDESMVTLRAHDEKAQVLTFSTPAGHPAGAFGVQKYVVWNVREGMKEPGQWYLDRTAGKVVYWPLPGEKMGNAEVLAPTVESILRVQGTREAPVKNVTVAGLSFAVTNTPPVAGGFGAGRYDGAVALNNAEDCRLRDLTVYNTGGQGIKAQNAARLSVENCEVHDTGACGMIVRGNDARVSDSHVHHVGLAYPSAIGIFGGGQRFTVSHNEVHDTPYTAVNFGGNGSVVEGNLIYRAMLELHDGAAFYIIFGRDCAMRGNMVRDIPDTGGYGSSAYYLDELSENCVVENNVSVNVARPSHNHIGKNNTIRNNIFLTSGDMKLTFPRSTGYTFERNVLLSGGDIVFNMTPEAVTSMPNNIIYSAKGKVIHENLQEYESKQRVDLPPRDGSLYIDARMEEPKIGYYRFLPESVAHKLGIAPVDVSTAGRRKAPAK